ncbi:MAG: hypothetical protein ACRC0S_07995 [Fusobacteriaceae bacterium]
MNITDIKIKCLENKKTMKSLAFELGISREWMYIRIKQNHLETIEKIKKIFSNQ